MELPAPPRVAPHLLTDWGVPGERLEPLRECICSSRRLPAGGPLRFPGGTLWKKREMLPTIIVFLNSEGLVAPFGHLSVIVAGLNVSNLACNPAVPAIPWAGTVQESKKFLIFDHYIAVARFARFHNGNLK